MEKNRKKIWTKIELGNGQIVNAVLFGNNGGDLTGAKIFCEDGEYKIGSINKPIKDTKKILPKELFPIKPTEKTPFVDFTK